ncbi:MAG: hypothetical protein QW795_03220 [Candidatus Bathyarchaeia archaeon]
MKHRTIIFLMFILMFLMSERSLLAINNPAEEFPSLLTEVINVTVNCTSAELDISSTVSSSNSSLVHFPPQVNMNRDELINAVSVIVSFSRAASGLIFVFNNTSAEEAKSLADSVEMSIEYAFDASFTWNFTKIDEEGACIVEYIGSGKSDLTEYLSWLIERCLAPGLGGFTLTFIPMSNKDNAFIEVSASKESGGFDWIYSMSVGYFTSIPVGGGPHKIDVLNLLNVESLEPSEYASSEGWFLSSIVQLAILSNETVSYVSSEPGTVSYPMLRGWYINPMFPQPPIQLQAFFGFANDPTPVNELTFTFSGLIIPELTGLAPLIALMIISSILLLLKKSPKIN